MLSQAAAEPTQTHGSRKRRPSLVKEGGVCVEQGDLCEILVSREHESIWYPGLVLSVDNKKGGCRVKYLNAGTTNNDEGRKAHRHRAGNLLLFY